MFCFPKLFYEQRVIVFAVGQDNAFPEDFIFFITFRRTEESASASHETDPYVFRLVQGSSSSQQEIKLGIQIGSHLSVVYQENQRQQTRVTFSNQTFVNER